MIIIKHSYDYHYYHNSYNLYQNQYQQHYNYHYQRNKYDIIWWIFSKDYSYKKMMNIINLKIIIWISSKTLLFPEPHAAIKRKNLQQTSQLENARYKTRSVSVMKMIGQYSVRISLLTCTWPWRKKMPVRNVVMEEKRLLYRQV